MHNAPWQVHQEVPGAPCGIYAPTEHGPGRIASCLDSSDARLIAAAPDLLRVLEMLIAFNEPDSRADQRTDPHLCAEHAAAWVAAEGIVAKARGR